MRTPFKLAQLNWTFLYKYIEIQIQNSGCGHALKSVNCRMKLTKGITSYQPTASLKHLSYTCGL